MSELQDNWNASYVIQIQNMNGNVINVMWRKLIWFVLCVCVKFNKQWYLNQMSTGRFMAPRTKLVLVSSWWWNLPGSLISNNGMAVGAHLFSISPIRSLTLNCSSIRFAELFTRPICKVETNKTDKLEFLWLVSFVVDIFMSLRLLRCVVDLLSRLRCWRRS